MKEGSERIASLIATLNHPDKKAIRQAVDSLISLAPHSPELAERLGRLLGENPGVESWAVAYVLAQIASPSPSCLQVLEKTLGSDDPDIRWAVALLLVRLGKVDRRIVGLLLDLAKIGTPIQRRMAVYCLRDMDPRETPLLEALLESARDPDPLVRVAAVNSLKSRPDVGADGLDRLLDLFRRDPDSRVRRAAAVALAKLGAPTPEIRAALEDASASQDPQLKKAARAALALLEKKGPVRYAR